MPRAFVSSRGAFALLAVAGVALAVAGAAQPPTQRPPAASEPGRAQPEPGRQGQPGGQRSEPRNVEGAMKLINRSLRQLNTQIGDAAKKDENLKLVNDAQRGAVIAKGMVPEAAPEEGRDKFLAEYRHHQITLIRMLLDLEESIAADKTAEAKDLMTRLASYRDESHKEFKIEEEGDGKGWQKPR